MSAPPPSIRRVAQHVPFSLRREMAKRFGYVEPRGGGRWAVRFQIDGRIEQSSMIRAWRRMEKTLKLEHVKPNESLRHCFGTRTAERLIREGMSREEAVVALMPVLGHTSRATTDRYVKLAAETLRGVIE